MKRIAAVLLAAVALVDLAPLAHAFCGFYVGKADAKLWNEASQVVLVRDGDRTVLTMANDYEGALAEFALVVPVPTVLEREQIHVAEMPLIDHLDAFTSPRLVEYFDEDPCRRRDYPALLELKAGAVAPLGAAGRAEGDHLGVTIEATYTVGEYDILILSATESTGLETWLVENGYRIPAGASRVLGSYLKQGMRFFVAKVNLEEQSKLGARQLRPLQIAYENPRFMLPIRLGMVNAKGAQDLVIYGLTRTGRIETTNYRTVRVPTGNELPPYVKSEFEDFYRDLFARQVDREGGTAVFLEHAWDMGWCDPCASDPLSASELRELGVFWTGTDRPNWRGRPMPPSSNDVFVTRLHVRYDAAHFPEDLVFQETGNRENFQGRYVLRHPWTGSADCDEARAYRRELEDRQRREAVELASLTGWELTDIRSKMGLGADGTRGAKEDAWWRSIWER